MTLALSFKKVAALFNPSKPFRLVWPTEYPVITQHYGVNPAYYKQFGLPGHEGVDFRAPHGSKIFACADGTVYLAETAGKGNYGNQVRIDHGNGYKTIYAHLLKPLVKAGDAVKAGDVIGLADNTGNSFGDHLHLTLKQNDVIVDPTPYLPFRQARPQGGQLDRSGQNPGKRRWPMGAGRRARSRQRASRRPVWFGGYEESRIYFQVIKHPASHGPTAWNTAMFAG